MHFSRDIESRVTRFPCLLSILHAVFSFDASFIIVNLISFCEPFVCIYLCDVPVAVDAICRECCTSLESLSETGVNVYKHAISYTATPWQRLGYVFSVIFPVVSWKLCNTRSASVCIHMVPKRVEKVTSQCSMGEENECKNKAIVWLNCSGIGVELSSPS